MFVKKFVRILFVTVVLAALFTVPVLAQGELPPDPVFGFTQLIQSLLAAAGVGSGVAFLLQLGKMWFPKVFPDGSLENWRLGIIVVCAIGITVASTFGYKVSIEGIDQIMKSVADLGVIVLPLFVWLTDLVAGKFYDGVLKGRAFIGKSYSLDE